ncbi:hypothetical protein GOP47_0006214 [Adiantum capillus-veneris]|uniref:ATP phosphoribosyltransferase n=1 Tax=Adiantum capillus-veneris TaxID=13818 RepID=A0A9D4V3F0_ADICA|nr:hypothetical protein GOP47_0006214 [Adiantum capillus-veneris]
MKKPATAPIEKKSESAINGALRLSFSPLYHHHAEGGQRRLHLLTCFSSAIAQFDVIISGDEDLIVVHDALQFGKCYLALGVPSYGIFANVSSVAELVALPQWSELRPLRISTGFTYLGRQFIEKSGLKHVQLLSADGALEAAPAMGIADAILDLIGSGTTLRENNLKQLEGSVLLKSQGVLVASKRALLHRKTALEKTHEILERLEAHLRARGQFTVTAHMRGKSMEEVANLILNVTNFHGLQGPTISPVFTWANGAAVVDFYAVVICVTKYLLYEAVKQLRQVGGSGVLVSPLTYIFYEEPPRWQQLLDKLKSRNKTAHS